MPYTGPILLEKIIGLELHIETPAFCEEIYDALYRYINSNKADHLKEVISRYTNKMDLETLTAHIQGVKRYIHTSDFYFHKKYDKTPYLFGAVTYVSKSEKLNQLDRHLDNLLAEQRKIMKPSSSPKPRRVNKKRNFLSSCALLMVSLAVVVGTRTRPSFRQEVEGICHPIDEHYDCIRNTPWEEVTQFFFAEDHYDYDQHKIRAQLINKIGSPGDIVSRESVFLGQKFDCATWGLREDFDCRGWDDEILYTKLAGEVFPLQEKLIKQMDLALSIEPILQKLYSMLSATNIDDLSKQVNTICEALEDLVTKFPDATLVEKNYLQQLWGLSITLKNLNFIQRFRFDYYFEKIKDEFIPNAMQIIKNLKNILTQLGKRHGELLNSEEIVKGRNRSLIKAIDQVEEMNREHREKGLPHRKHFVPFGGNHGIPEAARNGTRLFTSVDSTDPQHEFRQVADEVSSAVCLPK